MTPLPPTPVRRRQRGITLMECLVCMSILSILVGGAVPSFADMMERQQLRGQSAALLGDLQHMRSEAIMRNLDVRMSFHAAAGGSCYVVHTGPRAACSCDGAGQAQCDAAQASLINTRHWQASGPRRVEANVASILFDPRTGLAAPGGTVRLLDDTGREIRHVVSLRGRVRACVAQGHLSDHPPC